MQPNYFRLDDGGHVVSGSYASGGTVLLGPPLVRSSAGVPESGYETTTDTAIISTEWSGDVYAALAVERPDFVTFGMEAVVIGLCVGAAASARRARHRERPPTGSTHPDPAGA